MEKIGLGKPVGSQLEAILNTVSDAILTIDRDGIILSANIATEILFSSVAEEILGQHIDFYLPGFSIHHDHKKPDQLENPTAYRIPGIAYENLAISKEAGKFVVEVSVGKIASEEDMGTDKVIVIRDITDRKAMQRDLELQMRKLEQSNENLTSFAQIVSHDLKEPLRKILFYSKKYLAGDLSTEILRASGKDIFDTATRMETLIGDLLRYISADKDHWFVSVDLNDVLKDVQQDLALLIQEKKASIFYSNLPAIQGNPIQLRQLMLNLISNSLKFSKIDQRPVINIVSKIYSDDEMGDLCIITLADNGIGFKSDYADKIFSPFLRLNNRQKYEGSGIGLAICKKVVKHHSGVIKAHSEAGIGSEFMIILPVYQNKVSAVKYVA